MTYYIIDLSTFLYRFKSVFSWAKCEIGGVSVDTSPLVGSIRSLRSNIYENIIIVLDGVPSRSKKILPSYKGTRVKDDTFKNVSVPYIEVIQFLTKLGSLIKKNITVVCSPLQETDEVISSLVHHISGNLPKRAAFISQLNQRNIQDDKMLQSLNIDLQTEQFIPEEGTSIIATTDGDFIQLQRLDNVYIDQSTSGKQITNKWTSKSTCSLNPCAAILYKAICGDVGDNIQGIVKSSSDLVSKLSSIDDMGQVNYIYNAVLTLTRPNKYQEIYDTILIDRSQFLLNWDVTFLKFISYPIKLEYPDYRIEDTIIKYNLKV